MPGPWEKYGKPAQSGPWAKYAQQPAEKPGLSLSQAAFPSASKEYTPNRMAMPWTFDPKSGQPLFREQGQIEQRVIAGMGDALSLPTRAAGALAGSVGYTGATGGLPFREALANPETGLMRPARKSLGQTVANRWAGGEDGQRGVGDVTMAGLAGLAYLGASVAEDPTALVGGAAKIAPGIAGKTLRAAGKPVRAVAADLAPKVRGAADRVQQTVLRPRQGDWNAGFELADVAKHGVQGSVDEVIAKSQAKITQAADQLRALIKEGKDGGARVNLYAALDAAKAKLAKEGSADLVSKADPIFNEFRTWAKVEANREGKNRIGSVDLLKAQEFKQMMGAHGAWEKTAASRNMGIPMAEKYQSRAAQAVYMALKDEIEKAAPEGIKEINKTLSDLIPIRNAAAYRKIVQDRNNPISLTDVLSGMTAVGNGPAGMAMLGATRFFKSGTGAKSLYALASKLEAAKNPSEAAFYANKLKALGLTAAEVDALSAAPEVMQAPNVIPFRKVAETETDQRRASR